MIMSFIQDFEADFQQKVSLKILNKEITLKSFTHTMIYIVYNWPG